MTARTDTVQIPVVDGQVVGGLDPHHRPVAAHYRHPSRWQRIKRSAYVADVREHAGDALAVLGAVGFLYVLCIAYQWAVIFGLAPAVHP